MPESKVKSNADLSDEELENRSMGREKGTSIIDNVTAGYALNNRKSKKLIDSIPSRHSENR